VRSDGTEFEYLHKLENWMSTTSLGPTKHSGAIAAKYHCVIMNNT